MLGKVKARLKAREIQIIYRSFICGEDKSLDEEKGGERVADRGIIGRATVAFAVAFAVAMTFDCQFPKVAITKVHMSGTKWGFTSKKIFFF